MKNGRVALCCSQGVVTQTAEEDMTHEDRVDLVSEQLTNETDDEDSDDDDGDA